MILIEYLPQCITYCRSSMIIQLTFNHTQILTGPGHLFFITCFHRFLAGDINNHQEEINDRKNLHLTPKYFIFKIYLQPFSILLTKDVFFYLSICCLLSSWRLACDCEVKLYHCKNWRKKKGWVRVRVQ